MNAFRIAFLAALRVVGAMLLVILVSWVLVEAAPGSTVERAARAGGVLPADHGRAPTVKDEILHRVAQRHRLDGAPLSRVLGHVRSAAGGDLGDSWRDGMPVTDHLARAAPDTFVLWGLSFALALALGLGAAVVAARAPGRFADRSMSVFAALSFSVPPVWLGILALSVFADGRPWRVVPPEGLDSASAMILPVACLALVPTFLFARHGRAALLAALETPWATAVRARGASREHVLLMHATRASIAAMAPILPVIAAYLFGASMVLEEVFGIHGLGALLFDASRRGDAPVIVGVAVVVGAVVALSSSASDLVHRMADPRLRM